MLDRPFFFMTVLWGKRFRDYFLDWCLPTLLAPNNIPALSTKIKSRMIIATRPEDWDAMMQSSIVEIALKYVEFDFIEIPPCPEGLHGCQHMGIGHKLCAERAFDDKAYGFFFQPDTMFSDGTIAKLQELAIAGKELVLAVALRFGEELFFKHLPINMNCSKDFKVIAPLSISSRAMVHAAINGMHSETLAYRWDEPGILSHYPAVWWPASDGVIVHSMSWAPLLIDYKAIGEHDTSTFHAWTIDGDYVHNNIQKMDRVKIYIVQDSDEIFLASWTPMATRPVKRLRTLFFEKYISELLFRQSYRSGLFDKFQQENFMKPVRWHVHNLTPASIYGWDDVEFEAQSELKRVIGNDAKPNWLKRAGATILVVFAYFWIYKHRTGSLIARIFRRDPYVFKRIWWLITRTVQ